MPTNRRSRTRRGEVFTGLILILLAFSYVTSLLLDFKFVSLESNPLDDLAYLSEHMQNQKISSFSWLATSLLTFIAIPFYITLFWRRMKVLASVNGVFMLGASAGFLLMAKIGLDLHQDMAGILGQALDQVSEQVKLNLFGQFEKEQLYRRIGSSCVGLFSIALSLTKLKLNRFPLLSSILLLVSGPVLIFFNWYDPDHLARTGAMAGIIIGAVIFCVRMINKGLAAQGKTNPEPQ